MRDIGHQHTDQDLTRAEDLINIHRNFMFQSIYRNVNIK